MSGDVKTNKTCLGWREWVRLPDLGLAAIKAKVDTGARTSALHAFDVTEQRRGGVHTVSFKIHPIQKNTEKFIQCQAEIIDKRIVTDSGGHKEHRFIIQTTLAIGDNAFPIELSLTNRDTMLFRMLLGRKAISPRYIVDPQKSYLTHPDIKNQEELCA